VVVRFVDIQWSLNFLFITIVEREPLYVLVTLQLPLMHDQHENIITNIQKCNTKGLGCTHLNYDRSISLLRIGTLITSGGVKLVLCGQTSPSVN